jgi:tripartite-type tricarboxylate transporter receptor subunit TctC
MLRLVKKRFVPALLLMGLAIEIAVAQNYPNKPVTLVAPYGVGGDSDFSARNLAPIASKLLGQNVIVQNIAGASGTIGSQKVRTSPPDGYTLLVSRAGSQAIVPALESSTPYKWNDFTFISLLDFNPLVCVVKPDAPYKNMKELIAVIKANPTKLNYSTAGAGTTQHLAVEVLLRDVGLPSTAATMIPYKSAGLATTALLSGEVDFLCNNLTTITGQLKGNAMRPLVTSSSSRLKDFPNIPTAKEEGMGSLEKVMGWSGLYGPPGLTPEVVEKWQAILKEVAKNPTWVNGNDMVGALSAIRSQAETEAFAKEQYELYSKLGSELNLKK